MSSHFERSNSERPTFVRQHRVLQVVTSHTLDRFHESRVRDACAKEIRAERVQASFFITIILLFLRPLSNE